MLSVNLSVCVLDETVYLVAQSAGSDDVDLLPINAHMVSYWEEELLQERLQELLQAASASDGVDAARTQVWPQVKLLHAPAVLGVSDLKRVSPAGRPAAEEAAAFPPGQQRFEPEVFGTTPRHRQPFGSRPTRRG